MERLNPSRAPPRASAPHQVQTHQPRASEDRGEGRRGKKKKKRTWNASLYAFNKFLIRVRSAVNASSSCKRSSNKLSLYSDATRRFWTDSREKLTRRSASERGRGEERQ